MIRTNVIGSNYHQALIHRTAAPQTAAEPAESFAPGESRIGMEFLKPRSVAVVGGTDEAGKPGNTILNNLLGTFQGDTHVVNMRAAKSGADILGKPAYASVKDIPGEVDLAVISIPGQFVESVIKDCAEKGVKNAVIISAGFTETADTKARAESLKSTAKKLGVNLMGPNCLGLISTAVGLNASFASTPANPGAIAMMSQSGGVMISLLGDGQEKDFGFSTLASMGNKMDIQESDLLGTLDDDDSTKVVTIYTEGIKDGRQFLAAAKEASDKVPVLVLKGGRSASGASAVSSHTGSLAGNTAVFEAAMKQAGVIMVDDEEHMADLAMAFAEQPLPNGRNLTIVTNGGGPGAICADNASLKYGLNVPENLDASTAEYLDSILPDEGVSVKNPVDLRGDAPASVYKGALEAALKDPGTDMAVVIMVATGDPSKCVDVAKSIVEVAKDAEKPIAVSFRGGLLTQAGQAILREAQIPVYTTPSRAARALGAMADYAEAKAADKTETPSTLAAPDKAKAASILESAEAAGRKMLSAQDCIDLFQAYNIPVVESRLSQNAEQSVKYADEIGYPVVMKIASEDVVHKKDIGGVILNLKNADEVKKAHAELMANLQKHKPEARLDGIQVMQMASFKGAREIIAGVKYDSTFGSTIMMGEGGSYVEVDPDTQLAVSPVGPKKARQMVESLRYYPILAGTRGEAASDVEALSQVMARVSQLGADFPQIGELDINPFLVYEDGKGVMAVDGRVTLRDTEAQSH